MKIAVDAMGGDCAPREIVKGSLEAAKKLGVSVLLVGDEVQVRNELGSDNAGGLQKKPKAIKPPLLHFP